METRVRRALVSVYDKEGVVELCRELAGLGVDILSSGGTAKLLKKNGIEVTAVSDYTGFPEMLDGRVKTLHPRIHAGILAIRSNEGHMQDLKQSEIQPIDLVVVNLYPFEKTASIEGIGLGDVAEMIDIGGPAMLRAAAKNFSHVGVVASPRDYGTVIQELKDNGFLGEETRRELAVRAFRHTAHYDTAVFSYLDGTGLGAEPEDLPFPERIQLELVKAQELRYGENPHQRAAFYRDPLSSPCSMSRAEQLQGKELSFNNILDFDAAVGLAAELTDIACVIIKHGNPCGTALGPEPQTAFRRALACDPTSAFGGVIAFNRRVDRRAAEAVAEQFHEGVIAPGFDDEALEVLKKKKKLRLLTVGDRLDPRRSGMDLRRVAGGLLIQDWDRSDEGLSKSRVATSRQPTEDEWRALAFAWTVVKHVKSNAIVYARKDRTVGIGAGQMSRVDSARIGAQKARSPLDGAVMASDAFFPFRDGIDQAAAAGVKAVVQPGGSIRDDEVIAAADEHGMTMVLTGQRHFRH